MAGIGIGIDTLGRAMAQAPPSSKGCGDGSGESVRRVGPVQAREGASSRELFTANRCEPEPEWIFVNRTRHELQPDLFLDPFTVLKRNNFGLGILKFSSVGLNFPHWGPRGRGDFLLTILKH